MIDIEKMSADAVELVFSLFPTAVHIGTYMVNVLGDGSADYDPKTDKVITPLGPIPNVRMLRTAAEESELLGIGASVTDVKFIIPAKDLPNVKPGTTDSLSARGVKYDVIRVRPLPVSTVHILYCRGR